MKTSERLKSLKQAEPFVLRLAAGRRIPEITAKHTRIMPGGGIPAQFAARVSHLCGQLDSACSTSARSGDVPTLPSKIGMPDHSDPEPPRHRSRLWDAIRMICGSLISCPI